LLETTVKALQETETGWRAAIRQISERGGLKKVPELVEDAALESTAWVQRWERRLAPLSQTAL
jgi:hypothetical protein